MFDTYYIYSSSTLKKKRSFFTGWPNTNIYTHFFTLSINANIHSLFWIFNVFKMSQQRELFPPHVIIETKQTRRANAQWLTLKCKTWEKCISTSIPVSNWHKLSELFCFFSFSFYVVRSLERKDFLENSHILSFVQLKSVVFNLMCVLDLKLQWTRIKKKTTKNNLQFIWHICNLEIRSRSSNLVCIVRPQARLQSGKVWKTSFEQCPPKSQCWEFLSNQKTHQLFPFNMCKSENSGIFIVYLTVLTTLQNFNLIRQEHKIIS